MSGAPRTAADRRGRRTRHPVVLATGIPRYVLAVIAGPYVLAADARPAYEIPLRLVHGALLVALLRRLGAKESSSYAALFVVIVSAISVHVASTARDDLTLQRRGEKVTVTVVREWRDPAEGRKARDYNYEL
ncbi:hypothetical protein [Streptomyces sp. NPDC048002]|uniref:hypothetical protein n=1 Tax=Streptomyces sp. NPDC048002 TaxID=3154344 RepID=UPI0033FD2854